MENYEKSLYEIWCQKAKKDIDLIAELDSMRDNATLIADSFYRNLKFGTGGLRGVIGAGTNRMNIYTVARATQGYANYLNRHFASPSTAIAYDSRIKSDLFARTCAEVFAANNIRVHIYPELMPTPALSFAVRQLHCSGGVVITASHNPAADNGYKVYGADGGQITTETAADIQAEIERVDIFADIKYLDFNMGRTNGMISYISEETVDAYIAAVSAESLSGGTRCGADTFDKSLSIVYTPLNGTGLKCVTRCLQENGFTNISVVAEQAQPDGNFPTCPYPNPEVKEALELALRDAGKLGSDLVLATDPDCDRVGVAVKSAEDYVLLSANETGLLLFDYICRRRIALGRMPGRPVLMKTIVTIDMVKQIAEDYGVEVIDVLTGFKFIGEQIGLLESRGEEDRYIFGFEESYGYLTGTYVRDKDAVNASLMICEMAAWYKARGMSLLDDLDALFDKYGYCLNTLHSYRFEGAKGHETMQNIMSRFREHAPEHWNGKKLLAVSDYKNSITKRADGSQETISLPKSNVLKYQLEGNCSLVVRPSGTEPKLKMYVSISAKTRNAAVQSEKEFVSEVERFAGLVAGRSGE